MTHRLPVLLLALALPLTVFVLAAGLQPGASAMPVKLMPTRAALVPFPYALYATGPSANHQSIHETGSDLLLIDGGLYGGDGGRFNNVTVSGNPPPPVNVVAPCNGCQVSGTTPNYNAQGEVPPVLYDIVDYQPGGQYAILAGASYHHIAGDFSSSNATLDGLYYVDGDVTIHNVTGTVSIVAAGNVALQGGTVLTTFDQRFPLLFTTYSNTTSGAIATSNTVIDFHGNLYAPNGIINFSGVNGPVVGFAYAKEIKFSGSVMTFICSVCSVSPLSLSKAVAPTTDAPYHGTVTYTVTLRNLDVVSDTTALVTDTLPTGVTFGQWLEQPADGLFQNGAAITWTGTLSASTSITFTFTATHTGDFGDTITNAAYFSGTEYTGRAMAEFRVPVYRFYLPGIFK